MSNLDDIPALMCKQKGSAVSWGRKVVSFYSLLLGAERKGRNLSSGVYCEVASGSARNTEELTVLAMVGENFGRQQLDLLPIGVSLVLCHVCALSLLFIIRCSGISFDIWFHVTGTGQMP